MAKTTSKQGKIKRPSAKDVREAAYVSADFAEAAETMKIPDLEDMVGKYKLLGEAWDRGRFLRRVRLAASECLVRPESIAREVQLPPGEFIKIYRKDRLVRTIWDEHQTELHRSLKRPLLDRVKEGDPKAVSAVQALFGEQIEKDISYDQLPLAEMERATGISRRQIYRWHKDHDLPRNVDKTYCLPKVIEWIRNWDKNKVSNQVGNTSTNAPSALEQQRIMDLKIRMGQFIAKEDVVALLTDRAARMVQALNAASAEQFAHDHAGETIEQLACSAKARDLSLRKIWAQAPEELIELSAEAKSALDNLLKLICETAEKHDESQ